MGIRVGIAQPAADTASYPVVLDIDLPAGTHAAWIALAVAPAFRRELELLLPRGVRFTFLDIREESGAVFIRAEIA